MAAEKTQPDHAPDTILDLDKLVPDRRQVKFGGAIYDLSEIVDFGPIELKQIEKLTDNVSKLQTRKTAGDASDTELQHLNKLVDTLSEMLVQDAPQEEIQKLGFWQKYTIIKDFHDHIPVSQEGAEPAAPLSTTGS
jgi:hypothetical protein